MKSLICFQVGKKSDQFQDKPFEETTTGGEIGTEALKKNEQLDHFLDNSSEETATGGEIRTDVGKHATNSVEMKKKREQFQKKWEQLQEQLEKASGGEIATDSEDFMELKERVEQRIL